MKAKVMPLLKEYNFSPNHNAKSLSSLRTKQILVVANIKRYDLPLQKNNFILESIVGKARERGYNIIFVNNSNQLDKTFYGSIEQGYFDGVIVLNPEDKTFVEKLHDQKIPFIISGMNNNYDYVGTNQTQAAYIGTKHLIQIGAKKIFLILDNHVSPTNEFKIKGYKQALEEANIQFNKEYIYYDIFESSLLEDLIKKMYKENNKPEAIFINSSFASLGAIRAINKLNIKVPEELKILTFGDTYICKELMPSLSAIKQNFKLIGEKLVENLLDNIEKGKKISTEIIDTELIIRESTKK